MDIIGFLEQLWAWVCGHWGLIVGAGVPLYLAGSFALARIFARAGEKPGQALIPFRRVAVYWRIAWDEQRYLDTLAFVAALAVFSIFITFLRETGRYVLIAVGAVLGVYLLVMRLRVSLRMAERFGKSRAFAVLWLFLLKPVGIGILALGSKAKESVRELA